MCYYNFKAIFDTLKKFSLNSITKQILIIFTGLQKTTKLPRDKICDILEQEFVFAMAHARIPSTSHHINLRRSRFKNCH